VHRIKQRYDLGLASVEFLLSEEDRNNLQVVQEQHPTWSVAMIFKRALGLYANNINTLEPQPAIERGPVAQATVELFGP
jgi:hypothetical protein